MKFRKYLSSFLVASMLLMNVTPGFAMSGAEFLDRMPDNSLVVGNTAFDIGKDEFELDSFMTAVKSIDDSDENHMYFKMENKWFDLVNGSSEISKDSISNDVIVFKGLSEPTEYMEVLAKDSEKDNINTIIEVKRDLASENYRKYRVYKPEEFTLPTKDDVIAGDEWKDIPVDSMIQATKGQIIVVVDVEKSSNKAINSGSVVALVEDNTEDAVKAINDALIGDMETVLEENALILGIDINSFRDLRDADRQTVLETLVDLDGANAEQIKSTLVNKISELVKNEKDEIRIKDIIDKLELGDLSNVTSSISLPEMPEGVEIEWQSSNELYVDIDGTVKRPNYGDGNVEVILTAKVSIGEISETRTFKATVVEEEEVDEISPGYRAFYPLTKNVTKNSVDLLVKLDEVGKVYYYITEKGGDYPYSSELEKYTKWEIPDLGENRITISGLSEGKEYDMYLITEDNAPIPNNSGGGKVLHFSTLKEVMSDEEKVDAAIENIEFKRFTEYREDTQIDLPLELCGAIIEWKSENTDVITNDGKVICPSSGDVILYLTAIVKSGEIVKEKSFEIGIKEASLKTLALRSYAKTLLEVIESDYTSESWSAYKVIVDSNLVTKSNTQDEIVEANENISDAQSKLVFVGKADLDLAKIEAGKKEEAKYTTESWKVLTDALALPETTNEEMINKTKAINDAVKNLAEKTSSALVEKKTELKQVLENTVARYNQSDYDVEDWTKITDAKEAGIAAIDKATEILAVQEACNSAINAMDAVETKADKALSDAVAKIPSDLSVYTDATVKILTDAQAMTEVTTAEKTAKAEAIEDAVSKLAEKVISKTALTNAISAANKAAGEIVVDTDAANVAVGTKWITAENKATYTEAIAEAQAVLDKAEATQAEINGAVSTLAIATTAFEAVQQNGITFRFTFVEQSGLDLSDALIEVRNHDTNEIINDYTKIVIDGDYKDLDKGNFDWSVSKSGYKKYSGVLAMASNPTSSEKIINFKLQKEFTSVVNDSIANNFETLGLVGVSHETTSAGVVTIEFVDDKVKLTSKASGGTTISVKDALGNVAEIDVIVDGEGSIIIDEVRKYITKSLKSFTEVTLTQAGDVANNNVQYADKDAVIAALPTTIKVTLEDDTTKVDVPVTWADTDTYNASEAADYTFTATWGAMPAGADNDDTLAAATVEVTVSQGVLATKSLKSFTEVTLTQAGDVANNNVQYADKDAVIAALPTTIKVTLEDDTTKVDVPVTWADTDTYNASEAADYTFTATWGAMPAGADNDDTLAAPTVEVEVVQG